jgi:hypothetical protein
LPPKHKPSHFLFRYDYYAKTGMSIVQFPSVLHEMALEALIEPFIVAKYALQCKTGLSNWAILRGKENHYQDMPRAGTFIADASFDVDGRSMFHIEIAFSQTWDNLHTSAF